MLVASALASAASPDACAPGIDPASESLGVFLRALAGAQVATAAAAHALDALGDEDIDVAKEADRCRRNGALQAFGRVGIACRALHRLHHVAHGGRLSQRGGCGQEKNED